MLPTARRWAIPYVIVVVGVLATVGSYYEAPFGFTQFLTLPAEAQEDYELAAIRAIPHARDPNGGYDGQFYVRLALEPLLRDPAIDKTLDLPPYRARRILLSWTAYAIGFGTPVWILEVFALQNVVAWLVMAWLLLRWLPPGSNRAFLLWAACLLTHGWLSSIRNALVDGPSCLLLAGAVVATESSRPWVASVAVGLAGLARETNMLGVTLLMRFLRRTPRTWLLVGACALLAALPLLLWMDYLRSIYRTTSVATGGNLSAPLSGLAWKISSVAREVRTAGVSVPSLLSGCAIVAFLTQASVVLWLVVTERLGRTSHVARPTAWAPIALSFAVLGLCTDPVVWAGVPGAFTRVTLPLAIGFNVLARKAPWPILVLGNLGVVPGVLTFVFRM